MRTTMCRTTTVTGILNNVSCGKKGQNTMSKQHGIRASWACCYQKKRGHGHGDKNKHDKTIQEWRLVCGYNSVGLGSRVSSSSEWFQSTYIPLITNVYGHLEWKPIHFSKSTAKLRIFNNRMLPAISINQELYEPTFKSQLLRTEESGTGMPRLIVITTGLQNLRDMLATTNGPQNPLPKAIFSKAQLGC